MPAQNNLYITDMALLKVIQMNPNATKSLLWEPKGKGAWNKYLKQEQLVESGRCDFVRSDSRFNDAIATLRFCGYLADTTHYNVTEDANILFNTLSVHPRRWPLLINLDESGNRLWGTAVYFKAK